MKYMTFISSCAFAGIANMLLQHGVDVQDRDIALGMNLPFMFSKEDGIYLAGPMLQTAQWFNLYLNTIGFEMKETEISRENIPDMLSDLNCAMLGLRVSPQSKHAVVYIGKDGSNFRFINNKWENSDEPEQLCLSENELLSRVDETSVVAVLNKAAVQEIDFVPYLKHSCEVLTMWKDEAVGFCSAEHEPSQIMSAMNALFRAVLLDGITMLELYGQQALADKLRTVQAELLTAVKSGKPVILCNELSMETLLCAVEDYIRLITSNTTI